MSNAVIAGLERVQDELETTQLSPREVDSATRLVESVRSTMERRRGVDLLNANNAWTLAQLKEIIALLTAQRDKVSYGLPDYSLLDKINTSINQVLILHRRLRGN